MASLREQVRSRAEDRCEYCHLRQNVAPFFTFHLSNTSAPASMEYGCSQTGRFPAVPLEEGTDAALWLFHNRKIGDLMTCPPRSLLSRQSELTNERRRPGRNASRAVWILTVGTIGK